jgi:hypothetical protein
MTGTTVIYDNDYLLFLGGWIWVKLRRTSRVELSERRQSFSETWCWCLLTPLCTITVIIESTKWLWRCIMTSYNTSRYFYIHIQHNIEELIGLHQSTNRFSIIVLIGSPLACGLVWFVSSELCVFCPLRLVDRKHTTCWI